MKENKSISDYPRYISNKPCGKDLFLNKPHESIANTLKELICNSENKGIINPVIGLDGDWGSGKSNVISILEKKLEREKYFIFTYDVWGHQEDLTRLSFLEEIIDWMLLKDNSIKNRDKWIEKDKKITAKYKRSNKQSFPKIKLMYFWLALIPLTNLIINTISESIVNNNAPMSYSQLKVMLLIVYLFSACISFVLNIRKLLKKNKREEKEKPNFKSKIKRLFDAISTALYFFTGKEIETKVDEYVLEDEPSVKRFNSIFNEFIEDVNGDGLIVVFDNMDRLSNKEKLMSIWSSIHTFFAEIKSEFKVWTIIPYDKKNLSILVSEENKTLVNEFINKTFFLSIRIPNAIYDNWKDYFFFILDSAFGKNNISENEKDTILNLFTLRNKSKINPRAIVSFVNDIVTLKILKPEMDFSYIALYSLEKDKIIENYSIMISFKDIEEYLQFFPDEESLSKSLASIYYNIDKDIAKNILFENIVEEELTTKSSNFSKNLDNISFWNWFKRAITNKSLKEYDFSNLILLFNEIIEQFENDSFIKVFASKMLTSIKDKDIYRKEYDSYLDNISKNDIKKYFQKIIENTAKEESIKEYCLVMDKLFSSIEENIKNEIKIESITVSADNYSKIFNQYQESQIENFTFLNLDVSENDLIKYFFENNMYIKEKLNDIKIIEYLSTQNKSYPKIKSMNDNLLPNIHAQTEDIIDTVLMVNRLFTGKNDFVTFTNEVAIYNRYVALNAFSTEKADVISGLVKLLSKQDIRPNIPNIMSMTKVSANTRNFVQRYISFSDLLKTMIQYKDDYLILLVSDIINNGKIHRLNSTYIFNNIKDIHILLDESVFFNFLTAFESWGNNWTEDFIKKVTNKNDWIMFIDNDNIGKYNSIRKIYNYLNETLSTFSKDDWLETFKSEDTDYDSFKLLIKKDFWNTSFFNEKDFYDSVKEVFVQYVKDEIQIDLDLFMDILSKTSKRITNQIALELFQNANSNNPLSFDNDKTLFILSCIILYGTKIKDYSSVIDFYLIKAVDNTPEQFNEFLSTNEIFMKVKTIIQEYKSDKTILKNSLNSQSNHSNILSLIKETSMEIIKKDESDGILDEVGTT